MKNLLNTLTIFSILTFSHSVFAQDQSVESSEKSPWAHESELSLVTISGNATSESSAGKQKTSYDAGDNKYSLTGRYLKTVANGTETARAWDATARFERSVSPTITPFIAHGAESDPYNGYIQRDNTDLGVKFDLIKTDPEKFFFEAGYRYTKEQPTTGSIKFSNKARLYTEYMRELNKSVSFKMWVEYLPDGTAYLANTEPSMIVMLNDVFSLKTGYLVKYKNEVTFPEKRTDTTFTTSIIAKF